MRDYQLIGERLWPHPIRATWKQQPSDFQVEELWQPPALLVDAQAEHALLQARKEGQNTQWVAKQLARFAGVREMDVGFHGLKDRHAVTTQWFSLYLGRRPEPDWSQLGIEGVQLLSHRRTVKKLRRGEHLGNRFHILLRLLPEFSCEQVDARLKTLASQGFPNYFGVQRFGHDGNNLKKAEEWFAGGRKPGRKAQLGLVVSAARSYLFNLILGARVSQAQHDMMLTGDRLMTDPWSGNQTATGPLLGGKEFLEGDAGNIETQAVNGFEHWLEGLHRDGVRTSRRNLLAWPKDLTWSWQSDTLCLKFSLGVGSFASVFLDQCFDLQAPSISESNN